MWISRKLWAETMARVEFLETRVNDLRDGERITISDGKVYPWYSGKYRLTEAVNLLAEHVGFVWKIAPQIEASLKGSQLGKTRE